MLNAQSVDSAAKLAKVYFDEAEYAAKEQRLWNKPLYGPMLFVDYDSRLIFSNTADSGNIFKPVDGIYEGVLPKEVMIANTSIDWHGKKWCVILWPLPKNKNERLSLLMHESFHRIQESLGFPARDPSLSHLNRMNGRIYFLLELHALRAALDKPARERMTDLESAMLFRKKRQALYPRTFDNERVLEMHEGLAEFTGAILGIEKDSLKAHLDKLVVRAGQLPSLIRSAASLTGPLYGYLLYDADPSWTQKITAASDFTDLISSTYHISLAGLNVNEESKRLMNRYDGQEIVMTERKKEQERLARVKHYEDVFLKHPVLLINLEKMNISFNPNTLFDLGKAGTFYPTGMITDIWGELSVTNGMLLRDWKVVSVPYTIKASQSNNIIEEPGWKLTLKEGWQVVKTSDMQYEVRRK